MCIRDSIYIASICNSMDGMTNEQLHLYSSPHDGVGETAVGAYLAEADGYEGVWGVSTSQAGDFVYATEAPHPNDDLASRLFVFERNAGGGP